MPIIYGGPYKPPKQKQTKPTEEVRKVVVDVKKDAVKDVKEPAEVKEDVN